MNQLILQISYRLLECGLLFLYQTIEGLIQPKRLSRTGGRTVDIYRPQIHRCYQPVGGLKIRVSNVEHDKRQRCKLCKCKWPLKHTVTSLHTFCTDVFRQLAIFLGATK